MIKLIMSDMDGTLLDENGNLPPGFDEVIEALQARGILFAAASGRQYYALLRQFKKYENTFIFLSENGAYTLYQGKVLFSAGLEKSTVQEIVELAAGVPDTQVVLCGQKSAYILSDQNEAFMKEFEMYYARYRVVKSFADVDDQILKISICDLSEYGAEQNVYPRLAARVEGMKLAISGRIWMDVMDPSVNKGVAVRRIQQVLGISPEECMVFGDYMNDLEMMATAYYSYAMENAHPAIKKAARFQAKSNREYGVLLAIREMLANCSAD